MHDEACRIGLPRAPNPSEARRKRPVPGGQRRQPWPWPPAPTSSADSWRSLLDFPSNCRSAQPQQRCFAGFSGAGMACGQVEHPAKCGEGRGRMEGGRGRRRLATERRRLRLRVEHPAYERRGTSARLRPPGIRRPGSPRGGERRTKPCPRRLVASARPARQRASVGLALLEASPAPR